MKETVKIINDTYKLLKKTENIKDAKKLNRFIGKEENSNFKTILRFYNNMDKFSSLLYINTEDKEKNEVSKKFKYICKWIISNNAIFQNSKKYESIPSEVLDWISAKEEEHILLLKSEGNLDDFYAELEHTAFRAGIEGIIERKDKKKISYDEKVFLNEHDYYYKLLFAYSMKLLERNGNIFKARKDILDFFIDRLNKSGNMESIITKKDNELKYEDKEFVEQYVSFILKFKSIFKESELFDDPLIKGLFSGKIKSTYILKKLFPNIDKTSLEKKTGIVIRNPFDYQTVFKILLEEEGKDTKHFYKNLVNHFIEVGMDDNTINKILREIIISDGFHYDILQFIADEGLDRIKRFNELLNNEDFKESLYLTANNQLFRLLKKKERDAFLNRTIYIPFDFAIRNLKKFSCDALENLQTHVDGGWYKKEHNEMLKNKMLENGLYKERKELSYEKAISLIKQHFDDGLSIDEDTFKACLLSITKKELEKNNIDTDVIIYYGESSRNAGSHLNKKNSIWINKALILNFLKSKENDYEKVKIFSTLFHEIRHLKQMNEMKKGKINFLTYNFIKEEIIEKFDPDFYDSNYYKMFIEEDARQFGIIDSMKFLKSLGIRDFDKIYEKYLKKLTNEVSNSNIVDDSKKKAPFRDAAKIDISDYISNLIYAYPDIINEYDGILKIEYEDDGTRKSLEQVLQEFYDIDSKEEQDNKFSIYYGIIRNMYERTDKREISTETEEKIKDFFERKKFLISTEDMRYYAKKDTHLFKKIINLFDKYIKGENIQEEGSNPTSMKEGDEYDGRT